jgi:hypothetical protein
VRSKLNCYYRNIVINSCLEDITQYSSGGMWTCVGLILRNPLRVIKISRLQIFCPESKIIIHIYLTPKRVSTQNTPFKPSSTLNYFGSSRITRRFSRLKLGSRPWILLPSVALMYILPANSQSQYWLFPDICHLHLILTVNWLVTNLAIRYEVLNIYPKTRR